MTPDRLMRLAMVSGGLLLAGCNTLTHPAAKKQATQQWNSVRARVKFQLAEQQYNGGLFGEAAHTVMESLALDPSQTEAYVVLSRANLELSRIGSAQEALDAAFRAGLFSPDLAYTQGVILEQQDELETALEQYAKAWRLDKTNVDYLIAQAECLVAVGREGEALALLDAYTNKLDDQGTVAVLAAQIAALMGDAKGSARRLGEAVVPPASSEVVAQELGLLLARVGRCDQAVSVLEPLVTDQPPAGADACGAVHRALATCQLELNDPHAAKSTLFDYVRQNSHDTLAQLLLAEAAVATDDLMTALRAIDLVEQHEPGHSEVMFVRAVIQWRRGDLEGTAAYLQEVLKGNPQDVEAHCLMAEIFLRRHDPGAARTHFEKALRVNPQSTWASTGLKSLG